MITAIVLNHNGGEKLGVCLNSLSWCDEIIVADDASSDESLRVAKEVGARILHLKQTPSYAKKRNQALEAVSDGWVLFVDSDEVVTPALRDAILKELNAPRCSGYRIDRRDIFLGKQLKYGEIRHISILRLAKAGSGTWERAVHERWNVSGSIGHIHGGFLLHTPHPTLSSFFDKLNEYTELEVMERLQGSKPSKALMYFQLVFYPVGKFVQNAVWRWGFLDGIPGLIHAYWMSLHSLMVRIKVLEALTKESQ